MTPADDAPRYRVLGLDFGQVQDWTAAVYLDWPKYVAEPHYQVRQIKRWELGTKYTEIVRDVVAIAGEPFMEGGILVCDEVGCGKPVLDMLGEELAKAKTTAAGMVGVTVTGGTGQSVVPGHHGRWRVAKVRLVSGMVCVMQQRRLHVAEGLPLTPVLLRELANYRIKVTDAGNETFAAYRDSGTNDDIVFAAMLALWAAENLKTFRQPRPEPPASRVSSGRHAPLWERR